MPGAASPKLLIVNDQHAELQGSASGELEWLQA